MLDDLDHRILSPSACRTVYGDGGATTTTSKRAPEADPQARTGIRRVDGAVPAGGGSARGKVKSGDLDGRKPPLGC
jgi:hypothetical protein